MEDGGARRRLQFCDEPYKNKTFYIDVKTKSMHNRVSSAVTQLGGTIETFLSKDIFIFITDAKMSHLQNCLTKQNQLPVSTASTDASLPSFQPLANTDSQTFSGMGSQNVPMMSRGRTLLMKAREIGRDSKSTNNSNDSGSYVTNSAVMKAFQIGVKIEHAINFLRKCKNVGVNFKPGKKSKSKEVKGFDAIKWDDKNLIKIEDMSNKYRPVFKPLDLFPKLYVDNIGGSPFDGPTFLHKSHSENIAKKEMKGRKFTSEKGGYCEMCAVWYTKSLKEHMYSSCHLNFVSNDDNFYTLDCLVEQLPKMDDFLSKFASGFSNKDSQTISVKEDKMNYTNYSCNTISDGMCVLKIDNSHSPDSVTPEDNELNVGDKEFFPLHLFADGKLFDNGVLPKDQEINMFSSDISQSGSPTAVLKDLLIKWSLQDTNKPSSTSEQPPKTKSHLQTENLKFDAAPSENINFGLEDTKEVFSLARPVLSLCCSESSSASQTGQLKLKAVYVNGESITHSHHTCKPGFKYRKKKLRKGKNKNKENNIYCSHKTSDTKLKLSKISVTPLQQKYNLKMFWQVKKTGDCKLVFSSKKRKNVRNDSESYSGGSDSEKDRSISNSFKRQRLVF